MSSEMLFALDEIQKRKSSPEVQQNNINTLLAILIGVNSGLTPALSVIVYKGMIKNTEDKVENFLYQHKI